MLGGLDCDNDRLARAKAELDDAVKWSREHQSDDGEQLRDCLSAAAQVYSKFHSKEFDEQPATN